MVKTKEIEKINDIFEEFYKLFYESEDLALKNGIKCLTHNELHIIEAIGNESITMNELSDRLSITMGTVTVAITKLEDKGFAIRKRSDKDRRKVYVSITKKGEKALDYHGSYHQMIISNIVQNIDKKDLEVFLSTYDKILDNLKEKSKILKPIPITECNEGERVSVVEIKGSPIIQDYFLSHGIFHYEELNIIKIKENGNIVLNKDDGENLELNSEDAKNIIGVRMAN